VSVFCESNIDALLFFMLLSMVKMNELRCIFKCTSFHTRCEILERIMMLSRESRKNPSERPTLDPVRSSLDWGQEFLCEKAHILEHALGTFN
jgi:hypothetical protein